MNKLITKARSGVTLVELLVVILIVTILSVSMLPLLQPFVVESQYAAEAIPVIGNLRTKIGVFQYDKGKLPSLGQNEEEKERTIKGGEGEDDKTEKYTVKTPYLETWVATQTDKGVTSIGNAAVNDFFAPAYALFPENPPPLTGLQIYDPDKFTGVKHIGNYCDIDYQELKGKRSKPNHYQYLVLLNGSDYVYFIGCFGDGNGLKLGTGYAVCEIVLKGHKYVGTWKRYKSVNDAQVCFTTSPERPEGDTDLTHTKGCYVPDADTFANTTDNGSGQLAVIGTMENYGWEF